ncbi:MAG: hypothetical protein QXU32_08590 [Nitrososphaerales archaeon]
MTRKAILFTDDSKECIEARKILTDARIDFVEYSSKDENGCCGGFVTEVPSIFAREGIFRGIEGIKEYARVKRDIMDNIESAYW